MFMTHSHLDTSMKIGEKIKKFREYRGFKQEVLAEKLQMTQAGYSRLERRSRYTFQ
jgi:transcriptional regulator with XRE-family HTH domain